MKKFNMVLFRIFFGSLAFALISLVVSFVLAASAGKAKKFPESLIEHVAKQGQKIGVIERKDLVLNDNFSISIDGIATDIEFKESDLPPFMELSGAIVPEKKEHVFLSVQTHLNEIRVNVKEMSEKSEAPHFDFAWTNGFNVKIQKDLKLVVYLPRNLTGKVAVKTVSGDLDFESALNGLVFESTSGDLEVKPSRISDDASIEFKTTSGEAEIVGLDGQILNRLLLKSISGDFEVKNMTLKSFEIETVSGDVKIRTKSMNHPGLQVSSVSGEIESIVGEVIESSGQSKLDYARATPEGGSSSNITSDISKISTVSGDISIE